MKIINTPLDPAEINDLREGDTCKITGHLFTARDAAHEKLLHLKESGVEIDLPFTEWPCFHCGPVMKKESGIWKVVSAGPTTSMRMEAFEYRFMKELGTSFFIGKGGMGDKTSQALEKHGGVYAQLTGGTGSLIARAVQEVEAVYFLEELGIPEAVWVFRVEAFGPLLITMDSRGKSLHRELSKEIKGNLKKALKEIGKYGGG